ncbi:MAG: methyltransferase family protein [Streptosporangiaceae bacterium]
MNPARPAVAATLSVAWGVALGGTFACALPYLLGDWRLHHLGAGWVMCEALGGILIAVGLLPIVSSFVEFVRARGTPIPLASPPRLVIRGCYRYVRNPIYVGFLAVLLGQTLLLGSLGLLKYTAVAFCIGAAAVRFYEEPTLARRFGDDYTAYKAAVRAWIPRLHPWRPPP